MSVHGRWPLITDGQSMSALPGKFRRQLVPLSRVRRRPQFPDIEQCSRFWYGRARAARLAGCLCGGRLSKSPRRRTLSRFPSRPPSQLRSCHQSITARLDRTRACIPAHCKHTRIHRTPAGARGDRWADVHGARQKPNRRLTMTRISTFAAATLAAIAAVSLASSGAFAHGGGGGGGGGGHGGGGGYSFGGGFAGAAGGYAHAPVAVGSFGRSSVVPRLVGSAKITRRIPTQTLISQFPKGPTPPPPPGNNKKPGWGWGGVGGFASVDVGAENCLIRRYLPNGRVLFKDICTGETALSR